MPKILADGSFFICANTVSKMDRHPDRVTECLYQVQVHPTATIVEMIIQNNASYEIYGNRPFEIEQAWLDNRKITLISEAEALAYKHLHELITDLICKSRAYARASGFCKFESDERDVLPSYSMLYIAKFRNPIAVNLPDGSVINSTHITDLGELITSIKGNGLKTIKLECLPVETIKKVSLAIRDTGYKFEIEKKLQPRSTNRRRSAE